MTRPADLEIKAAPAALLRETKAFGEVGGLTLSPDDPEGTTWVIAAVTGVEDDVQDIIEPGAFARTLTKRQIKGCVGHEWNRQAAIQRAAVELLPGDPRLPTHTLAPDGTEVPWPAEAGALAVKASYMLDTDEGRNAWGRAKANGGHQAYSIGYRVVPDRTFQDKVGVRHIGDLDVFEFSDVLHGAHPLARGIAVKADEPDGIETKAIRYVRDPEYWGYPLGTPITARMKPRGRKARAVRRGGKPAKATTGTTTTPPTKAPKDAAPRGPVPLKNRISTDPSKDRASVREEVETAEPGLFAEPDRVREVGVRASRRATGDVDSILDRVDEVGFGDREVDDVLTPKLIREGLDPDEVREALAERRGIDLDVDPAAPRRFGDTSDEDRAELDDFMADYIEAYDVVARDQPTPRDGDDNPELEAAMNAVADIWEADGDDIPTTADEKLDAAERAADRGDDVAAAALVEAAAYDESLEGADTSVDKNIREGRIAASEAAYNITGGMPPNARRLLAAVAMRNYDDEVGNTDGIAKALVGMIDSDPSEPIMKPGSGGRGARVLRPEVNPNSAETQFAQALALADPDERDALILNAASMRDATRLRPLTEAYGPDDALDSDSLTDMADGEDRARSDEAVYGTALAALASFTDNDDPATRAAAIEKLAKQNGVATRDVAAELDEIATEFGRVTDPDRPARYNRTGDVVRALRGEAPDDASTEAAVAAGDSAGDYDAARLANRLARMNKREAAAELDSLNLTPTQLDDLDGEFEARAAQLGSPGAISKPHSAIKERIAAAPAADENGSDLSAMTTAQLRAERARLRDDPDADPGQRRAVRDMLGQRGEEALAAYSAIPGRSSAGKLDTTPSDRGRRQILSKMSDEDLAKTRADFEYQHENMGREGLPEGGNYGSVVNEQQARADGPARGRAAAKKRTDAFAASEERRLAAERRAGITGVSESAKLANLQTRKLKLTGDDRERARIFAGMSDEQLVAVDRILEREDRLNGLPAGESSVVRDAVLADLERRENGGGDPIATAARASLEKAGTKGEFRRAVEKLSDDELSAAVGLYDDQAREGGAEKLTKRHQLALDEQNRRETSSLAKLGAGARESELSGLDARRRDELRKANDAALSYMYPRRLLAQRGEITRRERLRDTFAKVERDIAREEGADVPEPLTGYNVLRALEGEVLDTAEVAEIFGVRPPRVLGVLNDLEREGYVVRNLGDNAADGDLAPGALSAGRRRVESLGWELASGRDNDSADLLDRYDREHPDEAAVRNGTLTRSANEGEGVPPGFESPAEPDPQDRADDITAARTDAGVALDDGDTDALADALARMGVPIEDDIENLADALISLPRPVADRRLDAIAEINVPDSAQGAALIAARGGAPDGNDPNVVRARVMEQPTNRARARAALGEAERMTGARSDFAMTLVDDFDPTQDGRDAGAAQATAALDSGRTPDDVRADADALDMLKAQLNQIGPDLNAPEQGEDGDASGRENFAALSMVLGNAARSMRGAAREREQAAETTAGDTPDPGTPAAPEGPTTTISPEDVAAAGQVDAPESEVAPDQPAPDAPTPQAPAEPAPDAPTPDPPDEPDLTGMDDDGLEREVSRIELERGALREQGRGPGDPEFDDAGARIAAIEAEQQRRGDEAQAAGPAGGGAPAAAPAGPTARIEAEELSDALDGAAADALGLTEADDGELEVDTDIADRQDRVEALLDSADNGTLNLSAASDEELGTTRRDLVAELALQTEIARRDRRRRDSTPDTATSTQGDDNAEIADVDTSGPGDGQPSAVTDEPTGEDAPPADKPKRRPGVAGAAQDYADAIDGGDADVMAAARARLLSGINRSNSDAPELEALRDALRKAGDDGHPDPAELRAIAETIRAATRDRRNSSARTRRTAKRLERERIRSLIGQINTEMRSRQLNPEDYGGIVLDDIATVAGPNPRAPTPATRTEADRAADRAAGRNPVTGVGDATAPSVLPSAPLTRNPDTSVAQFRSRMAETLTAREANGRDMSKVKGPDNYQWDTMVVSPGGNLYAIKRSDGPGYSIMHASGLSVPGNDGAARMSRADVGVYLDALERSRIGDQQIDWSGTGAEVAQRLVAMGRNAGEGNRGVEGLADDAIASIAVRLIDGGKPEARVVGDLASSRMEHRKFDGPNARVRADHIIDNWFESAGRSTNYGRVARYGERRTEDQIAADRLTERVRLGALNLYRLGAPDRAIALLEARADALGTRDDNDRNGTAASAATGNYGMQDDARGAVALRKAAQALRMHYAPRPVLPHALRESMREGDRFAADMGDGPEVWTFDGSTGGARFGERGGFIATGPDGRTRQFVTGLGSGARTGNLWMEAGSADEVGADGVRRQRYLTPGGAQEGRMLPLGPGEPAPASAAEFAAAHDQFIDDAFGPDNEASVDDWKARGQQLTGRAAPTPGSRATRTRTATRRPAQARQADIPAQPQLAAISADNRRAVLGAMADRTTFSDEPNYDRTRNLDEIMAEWAAEDGHPKATMRQGLAADTGRFRGAQVSDGGMFVVDRSGTITHAPTGLNMGRGTYDLTQAHSLRMANLLERAVVDGEPLDWQDRQNPRAIAQLKKGSSGSQSLLTPFRMLSGLGDGATGDDWVRARQGDPDATFDDRPLVESMPNPDATSGAFAQLVHVTGYRPGVQGAKYPTKAQEAVGRRVAKAARDAQGLLFVDPHRAAEIIAEAIGRDGEQTLSPNSVSGGNPGARKVVDMLTPVLDQIGLSADGSRRTELSKLRGARFTGRITPGAGAVVAMDDLVDVGPTAQAKVDAGRVIADRVRAAITTDGVELVGSGDGTQIVGVRLPRSADLGPTNGWEGDTADAYMIRQSRPGQERGGARMSRVSVEPDGSIKMTWRQALAAGSTDTGALGSESIMRVSIPAGSWRMGGPETPAADPGAKPGAPAVEPLSTPEYEAYTEALQKRIDKALADGLATDAQFSRDGKGEVWSPERAAIHDEIVEEVWQANFAAVPSDGKALFSGGLGGSGKGTVLGKLPGDVKSQYATIDPDGFKEALAARGLVPKVEGMAPMEGAGLIHEESSHLAKLIAERAMRERKNLIYDITMASEKSVTKKMALLEAAGYQAPSVVFVDVPIETSVERALSRHRNGMERYRNGEGLGGRYVAPSVIRGNVTDTEFNSNNRVVFEGLRPRLGAWSLYDNSVPGRQPVLLADSLGGGIGDRYSGPDGWRQYQADQTASYVGDMLGEDAPLGEVDRLGPNGEVLPDEAQPPAVLAARARRAAGSLVSGNPGAGQSQQFGDAPPMGSDPAQSVGNPGAGQAGGGAPFPSGRQ